jgi:hypothetical protein
MALRLATALAVVLLALASGGCGGDDGTGPATAPGGVSEAGTGGDAFPSLNLRDWVSYADHVAVYSVAGEQAVPTTPEELETDGGVQGRVVTLETRRVLWSAKGAPPLPETFTMDALGWVYEEGRRYEMAMSDAPRVAVGETYVAPLARVRDGTGQLAWWPLATGAQLPVASAKVTLPAAGQSEWEHPLISGLAGMTMTTLSARLDLSRPLPAAAKHMELRPWERYQAVLEELRAGQPVPPGETP